MAKKCEMNKFNKRRGELPGNYKCPKWFRAKQYGYGWYPNTWQGWLILTIFILSVVFWAFYFDKNSHSISDTLRPWFITIFLELILLIWIVYKTGEKPGWRWNGKLVKKK